ncbi:MAG: 4Fe-4S binding protein [Bacteroidota bacterium]
MKRDIIKINEDLCTGCGECVPNCHEGALQVIDGKVRLISDLMCDGLGACIGHCPEGAITIEQREALPYDETAVIKEMVKKGKNVVIAHLQHLKEHDAMNYLREGIAYMEEHKNELGFDLKEVKNAVHNNIKAGEVTACGCPGAKTMSFAPQDNKGNSEHTGEVKSALRQWPVQMHLVNPIAPYFQNSDFVLAADCVAYALGNFHQKYLKDKSLAIACPKLDSNTEVYIDKLKRLIDDAKVNTITVMMMEVPCCGGLLQMVKMAAEKAQRKVPVKTIIVGIQGEILSEEWS